MKLRRIVLIIILERNFHRIRDMNLQTLVYLRRQKQDLALKSSLAAIQKAPFDVDAITYFGYANLLVKEYEKARHYLEKALEMNTPNQFFVRLCLIQNSINENETKKTKFFSDQLIDTFALEQILKGLKEVGPVTYPIIPLEIDKIRDSIFCQIKNKISKSLCSNQ